jgi:hypothetical protein
LTVTGATNSYAVIEDTLVATYPVGADGCSELISGASTHETGGHTMRASPASYD